MHQSIEVLPASALPALSDDDAGFGALDTGKGALPRYMQRVKQEGEEDRRPRILPGLAGDHQGRERHHGQEGRQVDLARAAVSPAALVRHRRGIGIKGLGQRSGMSPEGLAAEPHPAGVVSA